MCARMITRRHLKGDAASTAVYSPCEKYRYSLTRCWNDTAPRVNFVMLNPSKATEIQNDPTVERCERRARMLGYGAFAVTNLFAWRDTDPKALRAAAAPIGLGNDDAIRQTALWAHDVIAAWGVHGAHLGRGSDVQALLGGLDRTILHLGLTKDGHPRHPLYLKYAVTPEVWALR